MSFAGNAESRGTSTRKCFVPGKPITQPPFDVMYAVRASHNLRRCSKSVEADLTGAGLAHLLGVFVFAFGSSAIAGSVQG
jgi:hypothetical protein